MNQWLSKSTITLILLCLVISGFSQRALATQLDSPTLTFMEAGHAKLEMTITAGATGAPAGFTIWWVTEATFVLNGSTWPSTLTSAVSEANFTGTPTLNTYAGMPASFQLGSNESINIQMGDLFDETGVVATDWNELETNTSYVFCVFANGDGGAWEQSVNSANLLSTTTFGDECHFTQGFWKNHPADWPLFNLTLGSVNYDQAELLSILNQPAGGNGLLILAHQLIPAKLNLALGAVPAPLGTAVADADALIGALVIPPVGGGSVLASTTSATAEILDDFNNGILGTDCEPTATESSTWGSLKELFR